MAAARFYTEDEVLNQLKQRQGALTQKEYAKHIGISPQFLGEVLRQSRNPSGKVLEFLGLKYVGRIYQKDSEAKP